MDETSVRLDPVRNIHGAVALTADETRHDAASLVRSAPLRLRRSAFTLVAFVADNDEVQSLLPRVILASSRVLPHRVTQLPHCMRRKNIWQYLFNTGR